MTINDLSYEDWQEFANWCTEQDKEPNKKSFVLFIEHIANELVNEGKMAKDAKGRLYIPNN